MQKLKLSPETISVLKNFASINESIYFKQGSVIYILSKNKNIFGRYECEETFESDFGIYSLNSMLSMISFFVTPEIVIQDKNILIKDGKQSVKIVFGEPANIEHPTKDKVTMPSVEAEFDITAEQLADITKAYSLLGLPNVAFESDGKKTFMKACNFKEPGNEYVVELAKSTSKPFLALFDTSALKLISNNYHVKVTSKGVAEFNADKLVYWIGVEKDSKFG